MQTREYDIYAIEVLRKLGVVFFQVFQEAENRYVAGIIHKHGKQHNEFSIFNQSILSEVLNEYR